MNAPFRTISTLVVIPCLNEADHIGGLLEQLRAEADRVPLLIAVADGGSTDGTVEIVDAVARTDPRVVLLRNPARRQSAGINAAVEALGAGTELIIRIDAHSQYPADYCQSLIEEAKRTKADSVVVAMRTVGAGTFQRGVAAAQNSPLGAGNSAHRIGGKSRYVDHGHHALMRVSAFRSAGGYDPTFSHNEDGELDVRLAQTGARIWLTDRVAVTYLPRDTAAKLFTQYRNYGAGRVRTLLKHRLVPKVRQLLPAAILPAIGGAALAPAAVVAVGAAPAAIIAAPAILWLSASLFYGTLLAAKSRSAAVLWSGPAALVMHLAWSLGFWEGLTRGAAR